MIRTTDILIFLELSFILTFNYLLVALTRFELEFLTTYNYALHDLFFTTCDVCTECTYISITLKRPMCVQFSLNF